MFCNKPNVNLVLSHLLALGVTDAVVCPGSRNAPIVHNLHEIASQPSLYPQALHLHPVTDERSAAFVAIGIWLATRRPVVVCVTSGSALLNLLPGVAEAYYRHIPLIILSADRPAEWIGQLDGQTLPQPNALLPYAPCCNLTESDCGSEDGADACRFVLDQLTANGGGPIHINLPLAEPLIDYVDMVLSPCDYKAKRDKNCQPIPQELLQEILCAKHPAVIVGQYEDGPIAALSTLQQHGWTIFAENISNQHIYNDTLPDNIDLLVHIGGALVEKRLKLQLRHLTELPIYRIDETDESPATFGHVTHKIKGNPAAALLQIADALVISGAKVEMLNPANESMTNLLQLPISAMFVGNSTAVRWANQHLRVAASTYCNRGVNGIEGSLSVAAGYSLCTDEKVLCVIGDLSFFYDVNALWNQRLKGNLRILLVNNNRGGIFYRLPGLNESPALDDYIAAQHSSNARGIAESYYCTYFSADTDNLNANLDKLLYQLLKTEADRPVIMEVFIKS